jgi:hypothetical protein
MFFGYHPDAHWKPEDSFVKKVELTRTSSDRQLPKAEEKKRVFGSVAEKNDEGQLSEKIVRTHSFGDMVEESQDEPGKVKHIRSFGSMAAEKPGMPKSQIAEDNKSEKLHSSVESMLPPDL